MKTLLFTSWILFGCAGYFVYDFCHKIIAEKAVQERALADSQIENKLLKAQVDKLDLQVKLVADQLRRKSLETPPIASPSSLSVSPPPQNVPPPVPPSSTDFPSVITTLSGKTYKDVRIVKIEDDCVTILDSDGGARVDLTDLSPDLQSKFGYDPIKAKAAADARVAQEKADAAARLMKHLEAEKEAKKLAAEQPNNVPAKIDVAAAQSQIETLQADINFMQQQEDKLYANDRSVLRSNGAGVTRGAYADRIDAEQAQISQLQAELRAAQAQ